MNIWSLYCDRMLTDTATAHFTYLYDPVTIQVIMANDDIDEDYDDNDDDSEL